MDDATRREPAESVETGLAPEVVREAIQRHAEAQDKKVKDLREGVNRLRRDLAGEVRTRRLIVVDEAGFERNIVAERTLGLPKDERPDKGMSWAEAQRLVGCSG